MGFTKKQMMQDIEDEAFAELERRLSVAKERAKHDDDDVMCYRNDVIEEVARAIEKFSVPFGSDTVNSFAVYVRGMKR